MINDLKEFEKFLKICRKHGATDVSFSGISVKLTDIPVKESESQDIETDEPTPEQMAFYAVRNVGDS